LTFLSINVITSTIGIFLSGFLIIIMIFKFVKNDPLYIYYCFALIISGLFFLFSLLTIYPVLGALLLPEILYIYTFYSKTEVYSQSSIPYDNSITSYMKNTPGRMNTCKTYKRAKLTETIKDQYNGKTNIKYSFILTLSLIITFIMYISI
jgi:hypothetical protein